MKAALAACHADRVSRYAAGLTKTGGETRSSVFAFHDQEVMSVTMVETVLDAHADAALKARERLSGLLEPLDPATQAEVRLVVTELVANAVKHGSLAADDPILFRAVRDDSAVLIEVSDRGPGPDAHLIAPEDPGFFSTHGRGLMIVDRIARRWGIRHTGQRTFVWAEIAFASA
jgi:anti-sigma regulatory factor (Ser/Thr protein kinase)